MTKSRTSDALNPVNHEVRKLSQNCCSFWHGNIPCIKSDSWWKFLSVWYLLHELLQIMCIGIWPKIKKIPNYLGRINDLLVNNFCKKTSSQMFDWVINTHLLAVFCDPYSILSWYGKFASKKICFSAHFTQVESVCLISSYWLIKSI